MSHRFLGCLVVCAVLLAGASCTRLGEPGSDEQPLTLQTLTQTDSIPAAWGKLVSVSSSPGIADLVQLWFQDDAGIIRMAHYNVKNNYLSKQVRMIGRD
jgi:hypothetical protein